MKSSNSNRPALYILILHTGSVTPDSGSSAEIKRGAMALRSSATKNNKYSVYVKSTSGNKKLIHIGDTRYGQYKDKLGYYSSKDHLDLKRRKAYYSRHGPATNKNTPKYWSHKILW